MMGYLLGTGNQKGVVGTLRGAPVGSRTGQATEQVPEAKKVVSGEAISQELWPGRCEAVFLPAGASHWPNPSTSQNARECGRRQWREEATRAQSTNWKAIPPMWDKPCSVPGLPTSACANPVMRSSPPPTPTSSLSMFGRFKSHFLAKPSSGFGEQTTCTLGSRC